MPPTPNSTMIRIPPAVELGEVAYRTYIAHYPTYSAGSWATWQQLDDDGRRPWLKVGRAVVEQVRAANDADR